MGSPPRIGRNVFENPQNPKLSSAAEELLFNPETKVIGEIDAQKIANATNIEEFDPTKEPPPWEVGGRWKLAHSDVRRFISDYPDEWELRWLNPKLIDQSGMRYWRAVPADHPRVKLLIGSMRAADNTIRKGDHNGVFLAYMPKNWVESRKKLKEQNTYRKTQSAMERAEATRDSINRGDYGNHIRVESLKHPNYR